MKNLYTYLSEYGITQTADSGREISRPKDLIYTHTGIIMGESIYTREIMVFHNHPSSGPAIVTLSTFADGNECRYTNRTMDSWQMVLLRSFQQVENGNGYALVTNNCHHASSYSRTGQSSSHGVRNTVGVLALIALFRAFK